MLAERIAIPNLVSRVNQPGLDARQMQILLLEKQKLDLKLTRELSQLVNPAKSKKKREELHTPSHWLYVR